MQDQEACWSAEGRDLLSSHRGKVPAGQVRILSTGKNDEET